MARQSDEGRPSVKGTYLLILRLDQDLADLQVGRLGCFTFAAGYYLYVGSAFGSGGLLARLAYHRQRVKAHPHWHVDYLRAHARLVETWSVASAMRLERPWARALLATPGLSVPVPRFGASDTDSRSHLFFTPQRPSTKLLTEALLTGIDQAPEPQPFSIDIQLYEDV